MLVVWPRSLYRIVQSNEGLIHQVCRAAATQRKRSPLRWQKKRGKTVKFDGTTEEVNSMTAHDAPIQRKTRWEINQRSLRVTRTMKFPKRRNLLIGVIAYI